MVWSINLGVSAGMAGLLMDMSVVSSLAVGYWLLKVKVNQNKVIMGAPLAVVGLLVCLMLEDGSVPLAGLPLTLVRLLSNYLRSLIHKFGFRFFFKPIRSHCLAIGCRTE